jgi:signal transduction histidine kinase
MVAVAAVLAVTFFGVVSAQRSTLTRGIDEELRQRADNIEPGLQTGKIVGILPSEGDREDSFLQIVDSKGKLVGSSANLAGRQPLVTPLPPGSTSRLRTATVVLTKHDRYRVLSRVLARNRAAYTLVLGKNLDDVTDSVRTLASSLALALPIVVALLGALVWWLTGRVLEPVEAIRAEVASIGGSQLRRRVPVPASGDEIARLAETMNSMLDRVEKATILQRQFVADASHELRSPLTRIRTDLEVSIAHPHSSDPVATYHRLLADAIDLETLFEDLLLLARTDAGAHGADLAVVDLDDLVLAEATRLRQRGEVQVDTNRVSAARVRGDSNQLVRVIRNLADNAERHAQALVTFELREHDHMSELAVSDDGPGISVGQQTAVFERFSRLDDARARDAGGSGLGLAIVHDIVERHGGTVVVTSATGEGARFLVTMPRTD